MTRHGLAAEGAAFVADGSRVRWNSVGGTGYAVCACGVRSPEPLPSSRDWHRGHKATTSVAQNKEDGQ